MQDEDKLKTDEFLRRLSELDSKNIKGMYG